MSKTVLYIPGLPGSHLHHEPEGGPRERLFFNFGRLFPVPDTRTLGLLEGPEDLAAADPVVAGAPIRRLARFLLFDLAKQAESLYEILRSAGAEVAPFGWDWRRPVWDVPMQTRLKAEVDRLHAAGGGAGITVIVHSTGGLILRHLLESFAPECAHKIDRVIAFGVPWAGTLKSLAFQVGQRDFATISAEQAQRLLAHSWAAFDLLPPDPARTDMTSANGEPLNLAVDGNGRQTSPLVKRGWFPSDLRPAMTRRAEAADLRLGNRENELQLPAGSDLQLTNVVGWGAETLTQARITGSGSNQRVELFESTGDADLTGGDETVTAVSAAWLRGDRVRTYHVPVGVDPRAKNNPHSTLWRNQGGRNLLHHLVGDEPLETFAYGSVDHGDFIEGANVRLRLVALDAEGRPLPGARVRTRNLAGAQLEERFDPGHEGRHILTIPRGRIREVQGGRLRRFEVEIRWDGGRQPRTFVVMR